VHVDRVLGGENKREEMVAGATASVVSRVVSFILVPRIPVGGAVVGGWCF
jgi:hypothetical protein